MDRMKTIFAAGLILGGITLGMTGAEAKRPLNHDDFDAWQSAKVDAVSRNGAWSAYSVVPQEGDAVLTFRNNRKGNKIELERGYSPAFTADGKWAVALIKPLFADTR